MAAAGTMPTGFPAHVVDDKLDAIVRALGAALGIVAHDKSGVETDGKLQASVEVFRTTLNDLKASLEELEAMEGDVLQLVRDLESVVGLAELGQYRERAAEVPMLLDQVLASPAKLIEGGVDPALLRDAEKVKEKHKAFCARLESAFAQAFDRIRKRAEEDPVVRSVLFAFDSGEYESLSQQERQDLYDALGEEGSCTTDELRASLGL